MDDKQLNKILDALGAIAEKLGDVESSIPSSADLSEIDLRSESSIIANAISNAAEEIAKSLTPKTEWKHTIIPARPGYYAIVWDKELNLATDDMDRCFVKTEIIAWDIQMQEYKPKGENSWRTYTLAYPIIPGDQATDNLDTYIGVLHPDGRIETSAATYDSMEALRQDCIKEDEDNSKQNAAKKNKPAIT